MLLGCLHVVIECVSPVLAQNDIRIRIICPRVDYRPQGALRSYQAAAVRIHVSVIRIISLRIDLVDLLANLSVILLVCADLEIIVTAHHLPPRMLRLRGRRIGHLGLGVRHWLLGQGRWRHGVLNAIRPLGRLVDSPPSMAILRGLQIVLPRLQKACPIFLNVRNILPVRCGLRRRLLCQPFARSIRARDQGRLGVGADEVRRCLGLKDYFALWITFSIMLRLNHLLVILGLLHRKAP